MRTIKQIHAGVFPEAQTWAELIDWKLIEIGLAIQARLTGGKVVKYPPRQPLMARAIRCAKRCMRENVALPDSVYFEGGALKFAWYYPNTFEFLTVTETGANWELYQKAQPLAKAPFTPDCRPHDEDDDCAGCRYGG